MNAKTIDHYVAQAEQTLNPLDWVPFVSSYSGMVRILAGMVEIAASAVFVYIQIARRMAGEKPYMRNSLKKALTYSFHGVLNMGRGAIAMIPIANLLLAVHDWKIGRFNYRHETMKQGVFPIATQFTCPLSRRRV